MIARLPVVLAIPWLSLLLAEKPPVSPLDLHHRLRDDYRAGLNVACAVREYRDTTGDRSFDSLERPSPRTISGLNLQSEARTAWFAGDHDTAIELYYRSYRLFLEDRANSEAGFSLYYIAEILSEQEKYQQSLQVLEHASQLSAGCLYLGALLNESEGYSRWYLDRLHESTQAFGRAAECWIKLGFAPGLVGAWNNLAALHEELYLSEQALKFYEKALEIEDQVEEGRIRFFLHANYALLLFEMGRREQAEAHLEKARSFSHESPAEFLLIESQIQGPEKSEKRLLEFNPNSVSLKIEKALLLADWYRVSNPAKAHKLLRQAAQLSSQNHLRYHKRRSVEALGKLLESERRYDEAAEVYQGAFKEEEHLYVPELLFPYSRIVSPLFDGWVRSLIQSGRPDKALDGIRRLVALRRAKAEAVNPSLFPAITDREGLKRLSQAAGAEAVPISTDWEDLQVYPESAWPAGDGPRVKPVLLELWPDGKQVYAWVSNSLGRVFLKLELGASINEVLSPVLSTVFSESDYLPSEPDRASLQRLYRLLLAPLEPFLDSDSLVVVVHKELQNLPFEMLIDENGKYVLESYNVSYLPVAGTDTAKKAGHLKDPVFVFPQINPVLPSMEREELLLRSLFPNARTLDKLDPALIGSPAWLHISAHFRLDTEFWLASNFDGGSGEQGKTNALELLPATESCTLVSLGVCHAANSYTVRSPYWLGLSELYLSRGATALVVSRWALDDLSMRIFRDFYLHCRQGMPMDEALTKARRKFLGLRLERDGIRAAGRHPYFWAGITYVGTPGVRLCESPGGGILHTLTIAGVLGVPLTLFTLFRLRPRLERWQQGGLRLELPAEPC
ncbi:MAG TPA: CHAT domain-containing tetratricopeptide repeat protein [Acidobacteriota bacterium]|nr:CHAT domain-containing tetratricopeptide repeat protein [Acidobacteriota bacterium]